MSLRELAATDLRAIHARDNDAVTLISPAGDETPTFGQVTRIEAVIDPQTNLQVYLPKLAITIALEALTVYPAVGWTVSTTDVAGTALLRHIVETRFDWTIGFVTMICEAFDVLFESTADHVQEPQTQDGTGNA